MNLILQAIKFQYRKLYKLICDNVAMLSDKLDGKMANDNPVATGSFSMGRRPNTEVGDNSHTEGNETSASGKNSHAEGNDTRASGENAHAEGFYTSASGKNAHAEGNSTSAYGGNSHAEGFDTSASGSNSHAEGLDTQAPGHNSHAEGEGTIASSIWSHVQGKYNIEDAKEKYAHIVGNGKHAFSRSNAHTLDWNGVGWFAGGLKIGGTGQDDKDAKEVALKSDIPTVDDIITALPKWTGGSY